MATTYQFAESIPENYDQFLGPILFADYAADLARRVAALQPSRVLELAAGTGIVTRQLRDALPKECELVASDLNPPMIEFAKAKFRADEPVSLEQADATELQFADASFDVVACQFGVMFFPDKVRSYAEVRRGLKPRGSYIFSTWDSWEENPFARIAHEVTERIFPENPPEFFKLPFAYFDSDEITKSVSEAGFDHVDITPVSFMPEITSAEGLARGLVLGSPLAGELANRGAKAEAILKAMREAVAAHIGGEMPLRALVVHARAS